MMGLAEHRREVAEIDERIIDLIQQRVEISKRIFWAKKMEGLSISDPEQERLVLRSAVSDIFRILICMSLQKQRELNGDEEG
jgi:chorismate mutase